MELESGNINIKGKLEKNSDISCKSLNVHGKMNINGNVEVTENISVSGKVTVKNIKCNDITLKGKITIRDINANKVTISASDNSNINTINGQNIEIVGKTEDDKIPREIVEKFLKKFSLNIDNSNINSKNKCEIECINGDDISLKNVKVKKVICRKAKILEQCDIESLIYSESVDIDESSKIVYKEQRR